MRIHGACTSCAAQGRQHALRLCSGHFSQAGLVAPSRGLHRASQIVCRKHSIRDAVMPRNACNTAWLLTPPAQRSRGRCRPCLACSPRAGFFVLGCSRPLLSHLTSQQSLSYSRQGSNATVQVKNAESHSITPIGRSFAGLTDSRPEGIACFADAVCGRRRWSDVHAVRACCITCAPAVPMRSDGASMQHATRGQVQ